MMRIGRATALAAGALALAWGSALWAATPGPNQPDWMAAHFIDVGQGEAVLLEFSCGAALVDTGGEVDNHMDGNAKLMAYLQAFFARRGDLNNTLDVVFLTHAHADHTTGAGTPPHVGGHAMTQGLIPASGAPTYAIRNVVTNAETQGSGWRTQKQLIDWANAQGVPNQQISVDDIPPTGLTNAVVAPIHCQSATPDIHVLWGSSHHGAGWESNANNQSVVVRVDFGRSSFLLPGDLEDTAHPAFLAKYAIHPELLKVDVYTAPHHGSHNGTTPALVAATQPAIAVINSGDPSMPWNGFTAHDFAHPNKQAIDILQKPGTGLSEMRDPKVEPIGITGKNPKTHAPSVIGTARIDHAIYDTAWDGDIVIEASTSGEHKVVLK
jgi:competence protein ComEC